MIQIKNGFVYNELTKELVTDFQIGNEVHIGQGCLFFYGTKEEAEEFGLLFIEN